METHNILKTAVCESISGRSTLTYQLSENTEDGSIYMRITENTGNGYFSNDWLKLDALIEQAYYEKYITAISINQFFSGRSVNTGAFLLAALRQEGIITTSDVSKRAFVVHPELDIQQYLNELKAPTKKVRKKS